jgi:hypothetical protein
MYIIRFDWFLNWLNSFVQHCLTCRHRDDSHYVIVQCKGKWTIMYVNVHLCITPQLSKAVAWACTITYYAHIGLVYRTENPQWICKLHSQWLIHYINRVLHTSRYVVCFGAFIDGSNIYTVKKLSRTTFCVLGKFLVMLPTWIRRSIWEFCVTLLESIQSYNSSASSKLNLPIK